jgi:hypothetical protein
MTTYTPPSIVSDEAQDAIELVARHVTAQIIDDTNVGQYWEDFPEIGEDDWLRIAKAVGEQVHAADNATRPEFEAAYKLLAARADQ